MQMVQDNCRALGVKLKEPGNVNGIIAIGKFRYFDFAFSIYH